MRAPLAAALALIAAVTGLAAAEKPAPKTHTVTMDGMRFEPRVLTVAAGDVVQWVNKDVVAHTATSKTGGFDSGRVAAAKSWSLTTSAKGSFAYVCTLHPPMTGRLIVK